MASEAIPGESGEASRFGAWQLGRAVAATEGAWLVLPSGVRCY